MAVPLLPICSIPQLATRDGYSGPYARIGLPFYNQSSGYWFASGQIGNFPGATIPQAQGMFSLVGTKQPGVFIKEPGVCIS